MLTAISFEEVPLGFAEALSLINCKLCNEAFQQTRKPEFYCLRNGIIYAIHGVNQLWFLDNVPFLLEYVLTIQL